LCCKGGSPERKRCALRWMLRWVIFPSESGEHACPNAQGCLAQLVERRPYKANVGSSSLSAPTKVFATCALRAVREDGRLLSFRERRSGAYESAVKR
jgi:hypothetical protein